MRANIDPIAILDKPYVAFVQGICSLNFQAALAGEEFKKAHRSISSNLADAEDPSGTAARVRGLSTRMYLVDLGKGPDLLDQHSGNLPDRLFGDAHAQDEVLRRWMEDGYNSQLCWLLVSAFELHERLTKDLYAAIGFIEPDNWRTAEFGETFVGPHESLDLPWYAAQVRTFAKNGCDKILSRIRTKMPDLAKYEQTNWIWVDHTDHRFWYKVIAYYRHLIVHAGGATPIERFWERIYEQTGFSASSTGPLAETRKRAVLEFVRAVDGEFSLELMKRRATESPTFHGVDKPFRQLLEIIVNYSCLVYGVIVRHHGGQPIWERNTP